MAAYTSPQHATKMMIHKNRSLNRNIGREIGSDSQVQGTNNGQMAYRSADVERPD